MQVAKLNFLEAPGMHDSIRNMKTYLDIIILKLIFSHFWVELFENAHILQPKSLFILSLFVYATKQTPVYVAVYVST